MTTVSLRSFKHLIVLFWALWWLIAFLTDFLGGLYQLGVLTQDWVPHSNYPYLVKSLAQYSVPAWLPAVFFIGIVLWSLLAVVAFVLAALTSPKQEALWHARVNAAFIVSLCLWFVFFLADQVIMMFDLEQNHMVQGGFQLLTFMAIHLLPDE